MLTYDNYLAVFFALTAFIAQREEFLEKIPTREALKLELVEYDFIVIGSGLGGSTVATRLSENAKYKVINSLDNIYCDE